jgi:anti-sigma factor RsiW
MSLSGPHCKAIVWKVGPYVDGELPAAERDEVEAHLAHCPDCAEMAADFRQMDARFSRSSVPTVAPEEWSRTWDSILSRRDEPSAASGEVASGAARSSGAVGKILPFRAGERVAARRSWALLALAAAAILILGIFLGRLLDSPSKSSGAGVARRETSQPAPKDSSPSISDPRNDSAELPDWRNGPKPEFQQDDANETAHFHYKDF